MFAYEIPGMRFSLPAGADIERHRFISVDASSNGIAANAETPVVGVSMNKTKVGEVLEVADGIVMVEAGEAITAGAAVYSGADGKATATGTTVVGVAITSSSASGQIITVKM